MGIRGFIYDMKYPKATACLEKDREELLRFYAFPDESDRIDLWDDSTSDGSHKGGVLRVMGCCT